MCLSPANRWNECRLRAARTAGQSRILGSLIEWGDISGGFDQQRSQPSMGRVVVKSRVPQHENGETGDTDRWSKRRKSRHAPGEDALRDDRDQTARVEHLGKEQESGRGQGGATLVAYVSQGAIGRHDESSLGRRPHDVGIAGELLERDPLASRERMTTAGDSDV